MANTVIQVNLGNVPKLLDGISGPEASRKLGTLVREVALFGERAVAERTPVRTGGLRASIHAQQVSPLSWRIASPLAYSPAIESGAKPHIIRPRGGRYLVFQAGGRRIFARQVHHPGNKPYKMFARSVPIIVQAIPGMAQRRFGASF